MGTSLGGMIATLYASRNLERVSTLTLFAPAGVYPPNPSEFQLALDRGENPLIATNARAVRSPGGHCIFRSAAAVLAGRCGVAKLCVSSVRRFMQKIWNDLWPDHPTLNEDLPGIDIPVLLVWGEDDRVLDVSSVSVFERLLPQVETLRVEGLGHAVSQRKTGRDGACAARVSAAS